MRPRLRRLRPLFILGSVLVVGWIVMFPFLSRPREQARRVSCLNNLKQIGIALSQYQRDFNGKYPPLVVGGTRATGWEWIAGVGTGRLTKAYQGSPVGWADAIQPYAGSISIYLCPNETSVQNKQAARGYTDYWLNGNLAGVSQKSVASPATTLLLGEGNDGTDNSNATYGKTSFGTWINTPHSPMVRHLGGANYLLAAYNVKWLRPNQVKNLGGRADPFALK